MGYWAYLRAGSYKLFSPKYEVPHSWCMIFEGIKPVRGIFKLEVRSAKKKLNATGMTLEKLEEKIAEFTGWPATVWKENRRFILTDDRDGLEKKEIQDNVDTNDDNYENALDLLDQIIEDEGLYELVYLYQLLILLEMVKPDELIQLNVREFRDDYDNFEELIQDEKRKFTDKVSMYNFLFSHTVPNKDQTQLVLDKLQELKEDEIIRQVLIPLLNKMGFHNAESNEFHGPGELGADTKLFYELDRFGNRFYYAAQIKAMDIHTDSRREGHAESVTNQLSLALNSKFIDSEDNEEKSIDRVMLITSGKIKDGARKFLHEKFENRSLVVIDGKKLAESLVKHDLVERTIQTINTSKS